MMVIWIIFGINESGKKWMGLKDVWEVEMVVFGGRMDM